ncbi:MAG: DUF1152 domain-containing protein [Anaerolineae bacterium]|nr:DUF1152 domain-containing protein [Anaerolineae bacterium]
MNLNLPIIEPLADRRSILIAGAGGGHDILAGLPLYFALRALGKTVHLANFSFTDFELVELITRAEPLAPGLMAARPPGDRPVIYYPEGYLVQWFREVHSEDVDVWMLQKTGAAPLARAYAALVEHLGIDALLLVDGGVDSLMRGDEAAPGTLIEDSISLAAVDSLDIPVKLLACLGFGTEVEEGVCHHHALENIAALAKAGGYYGACALIPQMDAFRQFEAACRYIWEQPRHPRSHITTRVIPAAHGEFGSYKMYPDDDSLRRIPAFISPLMSLYWFFDANIVIRRSLIIDALRHTTSTREAFARYITLTRSGQFPIRPTKNIPML